MLIGEVAGYVASALVFMTFYMKTMTPLRVVAVMSNIAFIAYAFIEGLLPVLILHLCLLPLNLFRLRQFNRLVRETRETARGELSFESLLPFMSPGRFKAGEILFRKGDLSREMFYICEGEIRLPELDKTIGKGETLGEIGLFAPEKTRTVTAICEKDCELLRMSEDRFLQLYNQNPQFGFHIVRVITSRLMENYTRLLLALTPGENSAGSLSAGNSIESQVNKLDAKRTGADSRPTRNWARRQLFGFYVPAAIVLAFLGLLLLSWQAAPYLQSVIVRDAAVTSWLNVATAPIDGMLEIRPRSVDGVVGPDGIIMVIRNDRLSRKTLTDAQIQVDGTAARVKELRAFLDDIAELEKDRVELKSHYADVFRAELDEKITGIAREISVTRKRLGLINKIAGRHEKLLTKDAVSQAATDEAWLRVSDLELQLTKLEKNLAYARVRREAADNGVFISPDGDDPDWVRGARVELKLQKKETRLALRQAEADLATARAALKVAQEDYARLAEGFVRAPAGSIVWNEMAAPGATVRSGEPVADWLDCSNLMIDVPVADAEVPLIKIGMEADVVLEGDSAVRHGQVLLTRGSAFTLGRNDLAVLAKGRTDGVAQVLLEFSHERKNFTTCPVGRAAHVDFPDIGVIDIIRARLRL